MSTLTFRPLQRPADSNPKKFPFEIRVLSQERSGYSDVFALRYRAYRDAWCIPIQANEKISDSHDSLATSALLAAFDGANCVGSLRVCFSHSKDFASDIAMRPLLSSGAELEAGMFG